MDIRGAYRAGHRAVVFVLCTGGGKTFIFSRITESAAAKGKRVYIVAHRIEIVEQIGLALFRFGVPHGWIAPGHAFQKHPIMVCMVQSLTRRTGQLDAPDLLVIDECHHASASTYQTLLTAWPKARVLGVTATPARTDGKGLGECFNQMVFGPSMKELIARGYLASFRCFAPPVVAELGGLAVRAGDFASEQVAAAMDQHRVTGDAVLHYAKHLNGAPAIAFCSSVEHAQHVAEQFREAGWKGASVDGSMPLAERKARIASIGDGRLNVLTSCDVISEGTDIPVVAGAILLRPTMSLIVFLQQCGRVLRPKPDGSAAIILDHVGNVLRMGMPDADREWSLEGKAKRPTAPPVRQCQNCWCCFPPAPRCPSCGFVFPVVARARAVDRQAGDGELAEITAANVAGRQARIKAALKAAVTRQDFLDVAARFGNKPGWGIKMFEIYGKYRRRAA